MNAMERTLVVISHHQPDRLPVDFAQLSTRCRAAGSAAARSLQERRSDRRVAVQTRLHPRPRLRAGGSGEEVEENK